MAPSGSGEKNVILEIVHSLNDEFLSSTRDLEGSDRKDLSDEFESLHSHVTMRLRDSLAENGVSLPQERLVISSNSHPRWGFGSPLESARKLKLIISSRPSAAIAAALVLAFAVGMASGSLLTVWRYDDDREPEIAEDKAPEPAQVDPRTESTIQIVTAEHESRPPESFPEKPITEPEKKSLLDLAASTNRPEWDEVLTRVVTDSESAKKFLRNPEPAVRALVGIHRDRREKALGIANRALEVRPYYLTEIAAVAILVELGDTENVDGSAVVAAMSGTADDQRAKILCNALTAVAARMTSAQQGALDFDLLRNLGTSLSSNESRRCFRVLLLRYLSAIPTDQAAAFGELIAKTITSREGYGPDRTLFLALDHIAPSLTSHDAGIIADTLLDHIERSKTGYNYWAVAAIPALVRTMDANSASKLAKRAAAAAKFLETRSRDPILLGLIATAFVSYLDAGDIHRLVDPVMDAKGDVGRDRINEIVSGLAAHFSTDDLKEASLTSLRKLVSGSLSDEQVTKFIAVNRYLPPEERFRQYVLALKIPTIDKVSREALMDAIKASPEFKAAGVQDDFWSVIDWLRQQPGVDVDSPLKLP